jgi:hypothetical protein
MAGGRKPDHTQKKPTRSTFQIFLARHGPKQSLRLTAGFVVFGQQRENRPGRVPQYRNAALGCSLALDAHLWTTLLRNVCPRNRHGLGVGPDPPAASPFARPNRAATPTERHSRPATPGLAIVKLTPDTIDHGGIVAPPIGIHTADDTNRRRCHAGHA